MTTQISIREVRKTDLPQVEKIEKSSFPDPYPRGLLHALASSSRETFLVATVDNTVVGYVSAMIVSRDMAHLTSIAVHPDYRKMRIARSLMAKLMEALRKNGITSLRLEVRETNEAAKNLYKSFGFQYLGTIKGYYDDGEDAAVMRVQL